jgi:hypothetical protein
MEFPETELTPLSCNDVALLTFHDKVADAPAATLAGLAAKLEITGLPGTVAVALEPPPQATCETASPRQRIVGTIILGGFMQGAATIAAKLAATERVRSVLSKSEPQSERQFRSDPDGQQFNSAKPQPDVLYSDRSLVFALPRARDRSYAKRNASSDKDRRDCEDRR